MAQPQQQWPPVTKPDPAAAASYLEFLSDDVQLFADLLDQQTLQAVQAADLSVPLIPRPDEATKKRIAEHDSDSDDDDAAKAGNSTRDAKRAKAEGSVAARNKATREKARREKINERFAELAALIDPGSEPKTDKPTILADAIKCVQQLRVENHQLKQLNKFLEERTAQFERERGQQLYQSMLMQQGQLMPGLMPPGMPGPSGIHAATAGPSSQPLLNPMHAAMAAAAAAAAAAAQPQQPAQPAGGAYMAPMPPQPGLGAATTSGVLPPNPYVSMLQGAGTASLDPAAPSASPAPSDTVTSQGSAAAAAAAMAAAAAAAAAGGGALAPGVAGSKGLMTMQSAGSLPGPGLPSMPMMPGGPPMPMLPPAAPGHQPASFWVPPAMLDSKQDSLLRPPAA